MDAAGVERRAPGLGDMGHQSATSHDDQRCHGEGLILRFFLRKYTVLYRMAGHFEWLNARDYTFSSHDPQNSRVKVADPFFSLFLPAPHSSHACPGKGVHPVSSRRLY